MPDDVQDAGDDRLIIIVGGDALALNTAREICARPGNRVNVLWQDDSEFEHAVEDIGACVCELLANAPVGERLAA